MDLRFGLILTLLFCIANCQNCPNPDGYFPDPEQCDAYIKCEKGVGKRELCPDGLYFNENLRGYPRYPCSYPQEVECGQRTRSQEAQPTQDCPRQYALFKKSQDPVDCGTFTNCAAGKAYTQNCPASLAFDNSMARCNWPDEVEECDAEKFVGFTCPSGSSSKSGEDEANPRYPNDADCRKFFVCINGKKPRANSCPFGQVFNPESNNCDEPSSVPKCTSYYPADVLDAVNKIKSFDKTLLSI